MRKTSKYTIPSSVVGKVGTSSSFGGNLKEIPKPHVRWYDKKSRKRVVKVSVLVYWGIGRHYHVCIKEDGNGIWDTKELTWREAWDDPIARGQQFDAKFGNIVLAQEYVAKIIKKHFPKKTHRLEADRDNLGKEKQQWMGMFKAGD